MPFPDTVPTLARALAERGYDDPTPVQAAVLADSARKRDLLVSARTGSGKTVAFGLAMADDLLDPDGKMLPAVKPMALVIAPTRELALQVKNELSWLYAQTGARIVSCVGGMEPRQEARALAGGAQIVVGTPGRLCDHLSRGNLDLSALKVAVLDEADEMLDLGFRDELETLLQATPETRRSFMFSATIAKEIARLAKRYQHDALRIDTLGGNEPHTDIEYRAVLADQGDTVGAVINTLRLIESPASIVFCHTRDGVRQLQNALLEHGFASVAISGELGQNERSRAIESLRNGQARVCVATDVAARGIDVPTLGLVIHASLPGSPATLLHRSGRTGRAGRKGICVLITPPGRRRQADRLFQSAGIDATWSSSPSADQIRAADAERLLSAPVFDRETTPAQAALVERLITERTPAQLAEALVSMWQAHLPKPSNVRSITPGAAAPASARGPREPSARYERKGDGERPAPRDRDMNGSWFRLSVGRADKADPKWLVPLLCRLGGVTKQDIGAIRIAPQYTLVEIAQDKAERFTSCASGADSDEIRIEPSQPPSGKEAAPARGRSPGGKPPARKRPSGPPGKPSSRKRG
ncbi:DEAD/DEAH box helicase [Acetobacter fallax]|uniref:DEAD/DEAH box helicase n=1 Tax=Acetobacter fallax TaxID=1737473 RepID=A0ABX0KFC8_9PROT|nr:DEAD/DEAH box helicase [Acetobacter fallax]NHO33828.1 DEAD/DEAH box helicase [Acetobacter fallax]NHO37393.1 DEAD/DEAH box helicase [Acetobacter fallax]